MDAPLVVTLLVGNLTIALVTFARVCQRSERSLFRYRMWSIRDEIVDAVLDGRLPERKPVTDLIDRLEFLVGAAPYITPYQLFTFGRALRRTGWKPKRDWDEPLPTEAQAILDRARDQAMLARIRLMMLGSPSGWLACVLTIPALPVAAVVASRSERYGEIGRYRPSLRETKTTRPTVSNPLRVIAAWFRDHWGNPSEVLRPVLAGTGSYREPVYYDDGEYCPVRV